MRALRGKSKGTYNVEGRGRESAGIQISSKNVIETNEYGVNTKQNGNI